MDEEIQNSKSEERNKWLNVIRMVHIQEQNAINKQNAVAKVAGKTPKLIVSGEQTMVKCTTSRHIKGQVIVERLTSNLHLPKMVTMLDVCTQVENGMVEVPVINTGLEDRWVYPGQRVGIVQPANKVKCWNEEYTAEIKGEEIRIQRKSEVEKSVDDIDCLPWKECQGTEDQVNELRQILKTYRNSLIINSDDEMGFCDKIPYRVRQKDDVPVCVPYRRVPPNLLKEAQEVIQTWLKQGIIRPSTSA